MMLVNRPFMWLALVLAYLAAACTSCTTKTIFPDSSSNLIKDIKSLKVYSYNWKPVNTGLQVKRGEYYTIIASGRVSTSDYLRFQLTHGYIGLEPEQKLDVLIDNNLQIAPPINATLISPVSGDIGLVVEDYIKDSVKAKTAFENRRKNKYRDNQGSFEATVIVWNTKDIDDILAYFNQFESLNPGNAIGGKLIAQARSLKESLIEAKFDSSPIDKSHQNEGEMSVAPFTEPVSSDVFQSGDSASIPDLQIQHPIEAAEESKKVTEANEDRYAPLMLLLSPREGQTVSTSTIQLIGVIEDDTALKDVKITNNGRPIPLQIDRDILIDSVKLETRFEFNQKIPIEVGPNLIAIRAQDTIGRVSEKLISIRRVEAEGTVWAVIIGVNNYPNLPELKYAVNDADSFHDLLLETEFVKPDNVFRLVNDKATLSSLRSILGTTLKKKTKKDDKVIIYFAGHGATETDINSPDGDGLEKYLLPFDADPDNLYATALPMREIAHILNRIQSNSLIFIADSCYSGASGGRTVSTGGVRSTLSSKYIDRIAGGKGRVILTASAANEVSIEDDDLEHGIFTYYLIKGLRGPADYDSDGYVTVDEAYRYVSEEVPQATNQAQHPMKKGSVEGQLILGIIN